MSPDHVTPHRAPRARRIGRSKARSASIVTRTALHLTCSSPAAHASSSREFVSTWVRLPVAGSRLVDSAVRVLLWKGASVRPAEWVGVLGVFMPSIVFFRLDVVIPNGSQFLGVPRNGLFPGANHG